MQTHAPPMMTEIQRINPGPKWSDVVIHGGVAQWVEVAEDDAADIRGQVAQVLAQIDATLTLLGCDRTRLLLVTIYLADLHDAPILNELWSAWVPAGKAPVRACVQAGLSGNLRVEMVLTAAVQ